MFQCFGESLNPYVMASIVDTLVSLGTLSDPFDLLIVSFFSPEYDT